MWQRIALGGFLLLVGAAAADAGTELRWKFKQGDRFYFEQVQDLKQTLEVNGQQQPRQETTSTTVYRFAVKKADAEGTVIEQKVESVKVKGTGLQAAAQQQAGTLMEGATFTLTLDPAGRVRKFEGYEDFLKRMAKGNEQAATMLRTILSEETLQQASKQAFNIFPDHPVNKGDTWKGKQSLSLGPLGTFDMDIAYTDEGKVEDGEKISLKPTLTYMPPKGGAGGLPFKIVKADFKTDDAKGTMVFDPAAGRVVRQELSMKLKGTMTLEVMGQERTVSLDQDQTMKVRVLDKNPAGE